MSARPDDVTIRDGRLDDRPAVEAVTLAAYEQYAAVLPPPLWTAYRQNIVATLAAAAPAALIVAEAAGRMVGSVLLQPAGSVLIEPGRGRETRLAEPEVRLLAVGPAGRGRGLGRRLMEECIRRSRAAGAPALTLHTTDMMRVAMGLYERMGFARAPELDFAPAPDVVVKGYRLRLISAT
ncbi:MAG TPA: GNAT family N-acetyltransferase [Methylomirabilota bacterium]|nr:GNAT family N-acetyltransferase [Methylomirabilota bacterium]